MSILCLKEHLQSYLSGTISRESLTQNLDALQKASFSRLKTDLFFPDLFLCALIPHLTTIPEQAYSDEELRLLLRVLENNEPFSLPYFCTIAPYHLKDAEFQVLCLAEDYLKKGTVPQSILFENKRYEFEEPKTLPALMAKDLLYLLWMAKKPQWLLFRKGLDQSDLNGKIERLASLLAGREPTFLRISTDHASVL